MNCRGDMQNVQCAMAAMPGMKIGIGQCQFGYRFRIVCDFHVYSRRTVKMPLPANMFRQLTPKSFCGIARMNENLIDGRLEKFEFQHGGEV